MNAKLGHDYNKLWAAFAVSNLGDGMRMTALPLLAATLTRDPGLVAAVTIAESLPWLLLSLPAGAVVDRVDRRVLMAAMQLARMGAAALLALAILFHAEHLVLLYVFAFLLGCGEVLFDNAAQSALPAIVRRGLLEKANGRIYSTEIVMNSFAGPPVGGLLFAVAAYLPFLVDAVTFTLAAALIITLRGSFRPRREAESATTTMVNEIAEGARWLWRHVLLRTMAGLVAALNLVFTATFSILVLYALQVLGIREAAFGLLLAASGVGSFVAGLASPAIVRTVGTGPAAILAVGGAGGALFAIGLTSHPVVAGALMAYIGFAIVTWNVITVSLRQAIVPDRLLGRVNSVYRLLAWGTMPAGAALGGLLGRTVGLSAPFLLGGGLIVLVTLAALPVLNTTRIEEARLEAPE